MAMDIVKRIYEQQKDYRYIKSINISRNIFGDECSNFDLCITLCEYPSWDETDEFSIVFEGVKDLKLGDIHNLFCVYFDIQFVSYMQMENINYSVKECENDLFSFLCKNILIP